MLFLLSPACGGSSCCVWRLVIVQRYSSGAGWFGAESTSATLRLQVVQGGRDWWLSWVSLGGGIFAFTDWISITVAAGWADALASALDLAATSLPWHALQVVSFVAAFLVCTGHWFSLFLWRPGPWTLAITGPIVSSLEAGLEADVRALSSCGLCPSHAPRGDSHLLSAGGCLR